MPPQSEVSLLIVFHGSRRAQAAGEARAFCERLALMGGWERVALGWIQFGEPSVAQALEDLAASGARRIIVAPMLLLPGYHLDVDIRETVAAFCTRRPECSVTVTGALAQSEEFAAAIAAIAACAANATRAAQTTP
ncbi:MAG: CbiX/SirB N-terminal domain-containing protein [Candidatus Sumerlaeota bacterium]|nr:CbiX/SirB N-terminal domain-containing protein [Candidatus Sumerlaeota bacterium]